MAQHVDTSDCSCRRIAKSTRRCACNCGASSAPLSSKTICHAASGVLETIEEVAQLVNNCECHRRLKRTSRVVECPSDTLRRSATECAIGKDGDSYRNVTWTKRYREGCRCLTKNHSRREICCKSLD